MGLPRHPGGELLQRALAGGPIPDRLGVGRLQAGRKEKAAVILLPQPAANSTFFLP